jgi:hypothetical protein
MEIGIEDVCGLAVGGDDEGGEVVGNWGVVGRRVHCVDGWGGSAGRAGAAGQKGPTSHVCCEENRKCVTVTVTSHLNRFPSSAHRQTRRPHRPLRAGHIPARPPAQVMKNIKRTFVSPPGFLTRAQSHPLQLSRRSTQDSGSSKKEVKYANNSPSATPPPPPPNNTKPAPPGAAAAPAHHPPTQAHPPSNSSPGRSPASSPHPAPDRRPATDAASPAPPIVVVSSDPSSDSSRHTSANPSALDHPNATPPRTTRGLRPNQAPKDTIPMVGKPPRKQRSSRFIVTEKVDIERLPPFMG